jgi:hypothetical protein
MIQHRFEGKLYHEQKGQRISKEAFGFRPFSSVRTIEETCTGKYLRQEDRKT